MKIGFIGAGHITELLVKRLVCDLSFNGEDIVVLDTDAERTDKFCRTYGSEVAADNEGMLSRADIIFICLQPFVVDSVVEELSGYTTKGKIFISVSAGIPIGAYRKRLHEAVVARILPNPPSAVGEGAIPVAVSDNATTEETEEIMELVGKFGRCFPVPEDKIDIFTSLTSPAPMLTFFETMIDAAVLCGLDRDTSAAMVFQTAVGCLKMWEENNFDLHDLIIKSSTPAGTSVESLRIMDIMNFRAAVKESYRAAWERSRSFAKK